jgi:hypothetical protein
MFCSLKVEIRRVFFGGFLLLDLSLYVAFFKKGATRKLQFIALFIKIKALNPYNSSI